MALKLSDLNDIKNSLTLVGKVESLKIGNKNTKYMPLKLFRPSLHANCCAYKLFGLYYESNCMKSESRK